MINKTEIDNNNYLVNLDLDHTNLAKKTLDIEAQAILDLSTSISLIQNKLFNNSIKLLLSCAGKVVLIGMGKSGHIANKIAATLASTGTPSFFVHPAEASHGDLGMIEAHDIGILISNSGETQELLNLLPALKRKHMRLISITGNEASTLACNVDIHLEVKVVQEACPHNLAPTSSTTAVLALGDAIAICLLQAKGFSATEFSISHPGGRLGKKLLTHVKDIMRTGNDIPVLDIYANLSDALIEMTQKGLGMVAIVNNLTQKQVVGIFTDGDLRRVLQQNINVNTTALKNIMHEQPKLIQADDMAVNALNTMENLAIQQMLVVDNLQEKHLIGAFNMHDLLIAQIV
jgi:arabinose-5-phosphate isomerase